MSLGSILVRLTMNTADFETDAGRAAKVAQRRAKEIDQAFRKAGVAIGLALGAAVTATTVAIKGSIDRMDDMSKAAKRVGASTEEFSRLAYAGELADVSMESLQGALGKLTKSQAAALKETSAQAKVFDALGISAKKADGSLRDSTDVLKDFADRFKSMQGSPEAMAAGFSLFGKSFQDLVPLLAGGSQGLREAADEADRLGKTISSESGVAAERFNDNLTRLQSALGGVANAVGAELLPYLVELTDDLVRLSQDGERTASIANSLANAFEVMGGAAKFVLDRIDGLGNILEGLTVNFYGLKTAVSGAFDLDLSKVQSAMGLFAEARALIFGGAAQAAAGSGPSAPKGPSFAGVKGGTSIDEKSQLRIAVEEERKRREWAKKLREAMGDPAKKGPKTPKAAKAGKSDAEREAESLQRAYESMNETLTQQIALFGAKTEVERVSYEVTKGGMKGLEQSQKDALLAQAAELDRLEARNKLEEDGRQLMESLLGPAERVNEARKEAADLLAAGVISQDAYNKAVAAHQTPAEQMLADMQFEISLLGLSADAIERETAKRWLGVEALTADGIAALTAMENRQRLTEEMQRQIELMDEFRSGFGDAITDFVTGAKSMKDAFADFADDFARRITQMIAQRWMDQLFGQMGTSGAGTGGGNFLGSLLSSLFGGGKGYSTGGYTGPGGVMQPAGIVHRGEVVWSQTDVARAGGVANVEAMRVGGGSNSVNQTFVFQGTADSRSRTQLARESGREAARAMRRNG